MGLIDEIKEAIRSAASIGSKIEKFNTRSIARGANEQSFHFPAIIDDTISVPMATTLTSHLDRLYASWTQIYLSSIGCIDLNYIKNARQFVAQYQPKFRLESVEEEHDAFTESMKDAFYGDAEMCFAKRVGDTTVAVTITPRSMTYGVKQAMKKNLMPYLEGYNVEGIISPGMRSYTEAPNTTKDEIIDTMVENEIKKKEQERNLELVRTSKDMRAPRMGDMDVRKINEMQPYMLEMKLLASKGDSSFSQWINYIVGVKTTLHLGKSDTLILHMVDALKNRNPRFNFIRWTTGEISLFKDIILHLDDINFDIASKSDRTGKYISSLKRLRDKKINVGSFGMNRLAPFATIVISTATYQAIKENYGFDLKNMTFAGKLMDRLFLMCFVIMDDVTRTVDILVDGQHDFQTYSLETLEREVTMNSNTLGKELTRMLGNSSI